MPKHPGGRPRKYTPAQVEEIRKKFQEYIDSSQMPIIAEFSYKNDVLRDDLYKYPEFFTLIKRAIGKKEAFLEAASLAGKVNTTQAIFSLKQLGWRDRQDVNFQGVLGTTEITEADKKHLAKQFKFLKSLGKKHD